MQTLILIGTYNERENIQALIENIFLQLPDVHILIIDDTSPDKTYELITTLMSTHYSQQLFLLQRPSKQGLGTAYVAGFQWGLMRKYDIIIHMDADFSHNPIYLPQLLQESQHHDLIIGSRYIKGAGVKNWGIIRRLISKGGSLYSRIILGLPLRDLTSGFKCFNSKVLQQISIDTLRSNGYSFQVETTYRAYQKGFKIKEIPIIFEDRRVGKSKMSYKIFFEALLMIIKLRFSKKLSDY